MAEYMFTTFLTLQDKRQCANRFLKFNFESSNYLVGMYYLKPKLMLEHAITLVRLINTCTLYTVCIKSWC